MSVSLRTGPTNCQPRPRLSTGSGRRSRAHAAFALALALAAPACGPRLMKLPAGPGTVAPDIAAVLMEATQACGGVRSLTAEIGVTGSVGGQRVRARLVGGFAPPSVRLEAAAPFGAPLFIFVASGGDCTPLVPPGRAGGGH